MRVLIEWSGQAWLRGGVGRCGVNWTERETSIEDRQDDSGDSVWE